MCAALHWRADHWQIYTPLKSDWSRRISHSGERLLRACAETEEEERERVAVTDASAPQDADVSWSHTGLQVRENAVRIKRAVACVATHLL